MQSATEFKAAHHDPLIGTINNQEPTKNQRNRQMYNVEPPGKNQPYE